MIKNIWDENFCKNRFFGDIPRYRHAFFHTCDDSFAKLRELFVE